MRRLTKLSHGSFFGHFLHVKCSISWLICGQNYGLASRLANEAGTLSLESVRGSWNNAVIINVSDSNSCEFAGNRRPAMLAAIGCRYLSPTLSLTVNEWPSTTHDAKKIAIISSSLISSRLTTTAAAINRSSGQSKRNWSEQILIIKITYKARYKTSNKYETYL